MNSSPATHVARECRRVLGWFSRPWLVGSAAALISACGLVNAAEPTARTAKAAKTKPASVAKVQAGPEEAPGAIRLVQNLSPADPTPQPAIDCINNDAACTKRGWQMLGPVPDFQEYAQGEYVGRARLPHVQTYRLRVDDTLNFVYRVTRDETPGPYEINVGDEVTVESATDRDLRRSLVVLPDGTVTLPLLGQVRAANLTVQQFREELEQQYTKFYKVPAITVTPVKVNTQLEDLRYTVGGRSGFGGQERNGRVTPEGTIQLPAVGSIPAQGLTLDEFSRELNQRYNEKIEGVEVTPVLTARAPRYVYVLGEVRLPGRYTLEAPTTVLQSIAMAGSYNVGAHISSIVIFRRADDWRLIATIVDLRNTLLGKTPCPAGELWVCDADVVLVPKSRILWADDTINLVFTKGLYGVVPFSGNYSITQLSTFGPVIP